MHVDVLIIGAGLSGIGAAYHLQRECPGKSYVILEGRERLGGTWDLFRYPGIRSDSDMYTLGYSFRPWTDPKAIADGASILQYLKDTASESGIDRHIRYSQRVERVRWSSDEARWSIEVRDTKLDRVTTYTARFIFSCTGYYDYEEGYTPELAGRERFRGKVIHPQKWPEDLDYTGKRVVVIGSGATAVTLVPELAKRAASVTMLQRSPTYIVSIPGKDKIADWLRANLPLETAYAITRWKNVMISMAMFVYCRKRPVEAAGLLIKALRKQVGKDVDVEKHFTPSYKPWDQRLCLVPDGDLFQTLAEGKAQVVTDHIASFTETGIQLKSGQHLDCDIIVTATGLKLKFLGGVGVEVDGRTIAPSETMAYKGMMFSDVPNLAIAIGYTNASWTLKCDLTSEYVCRLLNYMDKHGYTRCMPRRDPSMQEVPLIDFSSGYVKRLIDRFPRQGTSAPWKLYQNYALDLAMLRHGRLDDGVLEFSRPVKTKRDAAPEAVLADRLS